MIKKAVIPVAGIGSRFLPITKSVPKEMLNVGDKPVIQYLVEEAVQSGIEEIVFVLSPEKELIRAYFSPDLRLEATLREKNKEELLNKILPLQKMAAFRYVYQAVPRGDGDAILKAEKWIGDEPFLVLFGDDLVQSDVPAGRQLIERFNGEAVIAVTEIDPAESDQYGIVDPAGEMEGLLRARGLVEKPPPGQAPSRWGAIGKYVCPPSIFGALKKARSATPDGELRLVDGFLELMKTERVFALAIRGQRFDTGRPEGLLLANQAFFRQKP